MSGPAVRVIKLGGSLLDWPAWPERFRGWRALQTPAVDVVIAGGGALVERLRELDRVHTLSAAATHWLAIDVMSITARIAAEALGEAKLVTSIDALQQSSTAAPQVFDARGFLLAEQSTPDALPCGWEVTSDSIAARVARRLEAIELVLLKSALPVAASTLNELAACGYVDAWFPSAAAGTVVRCVNLRDGEFGQILVGG